MSAELVQDTRTAASKQCKWTTKQLGKSFPCIDSFVHCADRDGIKIELHLLVLMRFHGKNSNFKIGLAAFILVDRDASYPRSTMARVFFVRASSWRLNRPPFFCSPFSPHHGRSLTNRPRGNELSISQEASQQKNYQNNFLFRARHPPSFPDRPGT